MNQFTYNQWSLVVQIIVALAASIFAIFQFLINKRLQKLQDYVSVALLPLVVENQPKLQFHNTGKLNLYLHKYEIDGNQETYNTPLLLACGANMSIIISVPNTPAREMPVRLYLSDEFNVKYISTGAVVIDAQPLRLQQNIAVGTQPQEQQAIQQLIMRGNLRAWTYKTEKFNWNI